MKCWTQFVCPECAESFEREAKIMGKLAQEDAV